MPHNFTLTTVVPSCLFDLYSENLIQNARLDELQTGITMARRNTNNFRYVDDTTLMAESEEEIKSLLMKLGKRVKKLAENSILKKK